MIVKARALINYIENLIPTVIVRGVISSSIFLLYTIYLSPPPSHKKPNSSSIRRHPFHHKILPFHNHCSKFISTSSNLQIDTSIQHFNQYLLSHSLSPLSKLVNPLAMSTSKTLPTHQTDLSILKENMEISSLLAAEFNQIFVAFEVDSMDNRTALAQALLKCQSNANKIASILRDYLRKKAGVFGLAASARDIYVWESIATWRSGKPFWLISYRLLD